MNDTLALLIQFAFTLPVLLFSLTFHEVSHGYVALRLGDQTARLHKRLSPNPLRHLDVFGSLLLVLTFLFSRGTFMYGWAKPVPVHPGNFKSPQRGMMWVGLAGPLSNLVLAIAAVALLRLFFPDPPLSSSGFWHNLPMLVIFRVFQLNIILMVVNLIPIPPLDGSRVIGAFLPTSLYTKWAQIERYGLAILFLLFFAIPGFNQALQLVIEPIYKFFLPSGWVDALF